MKIQIINTLGFARVVRDPLTISDQNSAQHKRSPVVQFILKRGSECQEEQII